MQFNNLVKGFIVAGTLFASAAQAASIPLAEGIAILEDDNLEYALDANGVLKTTGTLVVGDRLRAVITFQSSVDSANNEVADLGAPGRELTGISEIEIKAIDTASGLITFGASDDFEAVYGTGAMAALFSQNVGDFLTSCHTISIAACETAATNGSEWMTVGFEDVDDFWIASGGLQTTQGLIPLASATIEGILATGPGTAIGTANYNLSILENNTGYEFNQQFSVAADAVKGITGGDGFVDLIGSGNLLGGAGLQSGYFARSDFDFQLDRIPVPEPSTLAIFGLGLLGLGFRARRSAK
jgi:hypothetical protein